MHASTQITTIHTCAPDREAEIDEFAVPLFVQDDVLGFEITVDVAETLDMIECRTHLNRYTSLVIELEAIYRYDRANNLCFCYGTLTPCDSQQYSNP